VPRRNRTLRRCSSCRRRRHLHASRCKGCRRARQQQPTTTPRPDSPERLAVRLVLAGIASPLITHSQQKDQLAADAARYAARDAAADISQTAYRGKGRKNLQGVARGVQRRGDETHSEPTPPPSRETRPMR
jgi:hypothetical protein